MKKPEIAFLILVFLLAFGIRFVFLKELAASPLFIINLIKGTDMAKYISWGLSIADGDWLGNAAFYQAPLFPYMLGIVFKLFGENIYIACLLQVILSALTCIIIYGIARAAFSKKVACVSSLISCFYGPFIFHSGILLSETLGIFLIALTLFLLLLSFKSPRKSHFFISGMILGIASLARPNFPIFLPFVLLLLFLRKKRAEALTLSLALCAGFALTILPVTLRNYIVSGRVVIITDNFLTNFRIGNSYDSLVYFDYPKLQMMPVLSCAFWQHLLMKTIAFWRGYEIPQNVNYYLFAKFLKVLRLPLFPFWLVTPLALIGIKNSLHLRRKLVVAGFIRPAMTGAINRTTTNTVSLVLHLFNASYFISVIIFFVTSRLRLPIMAGLIPFAAVSLCNLHEQLNSRAYRKLLLNCIPLVCLTLLIIPWQRERIRLTDYWGLGIAMHRKNMYPDTTDHLTEYLKLELGKTDYAIRDALHKRRNSQQE